MAHSNIYIRKENESKWKLIEDKSAWVNDRLGENIIVSSSDVPMTPENPSMLKIIKKPLGTLKPEKACKHGFPPAFCRFAKPGKPCK